MKNGRQQDNSFLERERQIKSQHANNGQIGQHHDYEHDRDTRHAPGHYAADYGREQMQSRNTGSQGFYGGQYDVDGGRQQEQRYASDNGPGRAYPDEYASQPGRSYSQQSNQDFYGNQASDGRNDGRYQSYESSRYESNARAYPRQYGNERSDSQQVTRGAYEDSRHARQGHVDSDYHQWRNQQIEALDNDYDDWRKERYQKFSSEFDTWRKNRNSNLQNNAQDKNGQGNAVSSAATDNKPDNKSK